MCWDLSFLPCPASIREQPLNRCQQQGPRTGLREDDIAASGGRFVSLRHRGASDLPMEGFIRLAPSETHERLEIGASGSGGTTGCSARQELTREQRVEKLKQQAKTADRERSQAQIEGLREGEREMARERVLENAPASSSPY